MIEFLIDRDCRNLDFDLKHVSAATNAASRLIEETERTTFCDVTVNIVSVRRIRDLHRRFLNDDSETDIITFPACDREVGEVVSGDIAVCLDVARQQATEARHTLETELAFLSIHGLLHLCGWDDETEAERDRMLDRQRELLELALGDGVTGE